jgi:hypothetical protein
MAEKKIKVIITDPCFIAGEAHNTNDIVEVDEDTALGLAGSGRAMLATGERLEGINMARKLGAKAEAEKSASDKK